MELVCSSASYFCLKSICFHIILAHTEVKHLIFFPHAPFLQSARICPPMGRHFLHTAVKIVQNRRPICVFSVFTVAIRIVLFMVFKP